MPPEEGTAAWRLRAYPPDCRGAYRRIPGIDPRAARIDPPAGGAHGYAGAACAGLSSSSWDRRRSWTGAGGCGAPASRASRPSSSRCSRAGRPCASSRAAPSRSASARSTARCRPTDVPSLQAASAVGQGLLAGAWQRALASAGGRAAQVLLTADDVRRRTSYLNARATLEALLAWDVVPIVNENDSTATDEITFGDNDALAAQVALLLRARLLVLLTDADGPLHARPARHGRRAHQRGARPLPARRARPRRGLGQRARLGRHALEGRRRLDGRGWRRGLRDRLGGAAGDDRARRRRQADRHALQPGAPAGVGLEALAALREAAGRARPRGCRSAHRAARRAARASCPWA